MSHAEMSSRTVTNVPKEENAFRVWIEKTLRAHYLDIKRIYNREIASDCIELIKTGNITSEAGNVKLIIDGDYLIMQAHDGSDWVATGWTLRIA